MGRTTVRSGASHSTRDRILGALCVLVAGATLASCAHRKAEPVAINQVVPVAHLEEVRSADRLASPGDPIWQDIPEYRVELQPAPPVHPSVVLRQAVEAPAEAGAPVFFRVASDRERVWIRLRWRDESRDRENAYERFSDAVALQFALQEASRTSYMMGSPDAPVNIWHWRASTDRAENLAAGGFGSLTRLSRQEVAAASTYADESVREWSIVFSRRLETQEVDEVVFGPGATVPLAFAIWQGAEGQRDGHKLATAGWIRLRFGDSR